MKRKAQADPSGAQALAKKRSRTALPTDEARGRFRAGLFDDTVLSGYAEQYAASEPYKHAVIERLVDDSLLRQVRDEIRTHVSFTPKETDIYKIHQSGDLANLDGCDDAELERLPSLLRLRDAIYSQAFRSWVSTVTGCGALSGTKTDMAVNVYTPGCFLLCHDDVIGSRKVSYILYLTDPDEPWKAEWGGALRLFPTTEIGEAKVPAADPCKIIPPAWNQLSFFAVQPGESFHDVEEVYYPPLGERKEGARVRMAISGWFHIPQPGEAGYVKGAEEELTKNSGLMQLSGNPAQYDEPQARPVNVTPKPETEDSPFDEADIDFLLKYIAPTYLVPETLYGMYEHFSEQSSITLSNILSKKFSDRLRAYVTKQEASALPADTPAIEKSTPWKVARPPHKNRFLFQQPAGTDERQTSQDESPIKELINVLLPSRQFRSWLQRATGCTIESHAIIARRFRRGSDYTLATGHNGKGRLELNLGFTPTTGWGDDEDAEEDAEAEDEPEDSKSSKHKKSKKQTNGESSSKDQKKDKGKGKAKEPEKPKEQPEDYGGHEVYMTGDDDDEDNDAAIYRTGSSSGGGGGDDDDAMLFFQSAAWNKMTIVLRDSGVLRFVKYVSGSAPGDRWDVSATFDIEDMDDDGDDGGDDGDDDDDDEGDDDGEDGGEEDDQDSDGDDDDDDGGEEFEGFSASENES